MAVAVEKRLLSAGEFYRLCQAGILEAHERVELADGELIRMAPIGPGHHACVMRLTELFAAALGGRAWVSVQGPLALSGTEVRYPDLTLLRRAPDAYAAQGPRAADALLVVEVADTSLAYDREVKLPRYAAAGVPEVWIVDLIGGAVEVHREPAGAGYARAERRERGRTLEPATFPGVAVPVAALLG